MSKSFLTPLNLNGYELLNARLQQLATAPSGVNDGYIYYDTTLKYARIRSNGTWVDLTQAVAGYTDEQAQDAVGALIAAGTAAGITVTYDDANNSLSFAVPSEAAAGTPSLRTIGTGATQAAAGNDARLSDTRIPTDGSVTDAKVSSSAAISADKLVEGSTNKLLTGAERTKIQSIVNDGASNVASQRTLGTGASQAAAGNDVRLSDTRVPTDGSVTDAKVSNSAAINADKIADGTTNKVYTATDKSKLAGIQSGATANSTDAQLRDRSTHTGTQSADTITDGTTNKAYTATEKSKLAGIANGATNYTDTNARANRLDQFAVPTASVSFNNQTLTNVATPVNGTDGVNKNYADSIAAGFDPKASVRAATTGNITLSGTQTIDTIALAAGDRVLVKNQSTAADNGIYIVSASGWSRSADANSSTNLSTGARTFVEDGSANKSQHFVLVTTGTITPGTTAQTWSVDSGASATTAGAGLTSNANVFNVGQGTGIVVSADAIAIDTTVVSRIVNVTVGDGTATTYNIAHNLGKRGVLVQVWLNSGTYEEVEVDVLRTDANNVAVRFGAAPAANAYAVTISG